MKKVISLLLAIMMIAVVLAGCDGKTDKLVGTWKAASVELDGTKYTISELEAMGDDSMSEAQIVIKESGKAYVADGNDGDIVDWVKTETGVKIGEQECTIVDGMICLEYGEGKVYFKKVSDSQTIGAVQDSDSAQENQDRSDRFFRDNQKLTRQIYLVHQKLCRQKLCFLWLYLNGR